MLKTKSHISVVKNFLCNQSTNNASELIDFYKNPDIALEDVAYLAQGLAGSGIVLDFNENENIADIASTGGPTSLSTLLCPLFLVKQGFKVLSLGVPGRPAGGIDVLAQIPDYRINLSKNEITNCIEFAGYAHFLANKDFAPADALLFKIRQKMNAQRIPSLVTASLLSKKIAVGVKHLGLDVRISPHGNFGVTWEEGRQNSQMFCKVAQMLGISVKCFLTDANTPYQPYVGRSESLLALFNLFKNSSEQVLYNHSELCSEMSRHLSKENNHINPLDETIYEIFNQNITVQGSNLYLFEAKAEEVKKAHTNDFYISENTGYLKIDLSKLRTILVSIQKKYVTEKLSFPDPVGIIFAKITNDFVKVGDAIASLRVDANGLDELKARLSSVFTFAQTPTPKKNMEVVENA